MTKHWHLLLRTPLANLGDFMHDGKFVEYPTVMAPLAVIRLLAGNIIKNRLQRICALGLKSAIKEWIRASLRSESLVAWIRRTVLKNRIDREIPAVAKIHR